MGLDKYYLINMIGNPLETTIFTANMMFSGALDEVPKLRFLLGVAQMDLRDGLLIGLAQALALVPGTSRSGITMSAGLALGLTREAAARFSFLLSVPAVTAAGALAVLDLAKAGPAQPWGPMGVAVAVSAVAGLLSIHLLLRLIQRVGMAPFTIYRLGLAAFCVYVFV
jgi:undecaprenyl-diphosphatase